MAIDTRAKRQSLVGISVYSNIGVSPDVTQNQAWRQVVGWGYSGILAGGFIPDVSVFWLSGLSGLSRGEID